MRPDPRIADTRRRVRAATLALIAEIGFEGTTIELIAERSGVSRTTIYRHWPDTTRLFVEAFDPPTPELDPPRLTGEFVADITGYIDHVAERLNDGQFSAALAAQIDKSRRDVEYRAAHLTYAIARNELGVRIFRDGIESGAVRPGLDPEHETDLILGFLVYQRLVRHRHLDPTIVAGLREGVLARSARVEPPNEPPADA